MSLSAEFLVRVLAAAVLGAIALVVIVPRLFPTATISLWLLRARRERRRHDFDMTVAARFHAALSAADRNALALLEALQYPRDLVAHALATIDWQVRR